MKFQFSTQDLETDRTTELAWELGTGAVSLRLLILLPGWGFGPTRVTEFPLPLSSYRSVLPDLFTPNQKKQKQVA